jgi:lipopolysaccharide export system permease protein
VKILDRLVATTFLKLFVVSILETPPLFVLGDLTERLDDYLDSDLTLGQIALGYVYNLPEYLHWSFPIAGLIAAIFTVHGMTTHREVVAAKAGGVSFHRLVLPVLALGTLLAAVALAATDVVPLSKRRATDILERRDPSRQWRSDFVYRSGDGLALAVQRIDLAPPRMTGVGIHAERRGSDAVSLHIEVSDAAWSEGQWDFNQGVFRRIWPDGFESAMRFDHLQIRAFDEQPEELLQDVRDEEELTYAELERQASIVERAGGNSNELRTKKEQKLAIPVATLVIILFGTPLATSNRRGGAAYGIGISLATTIVYLLLFRVSAGLGSAGALTPMQAAWLPNLLFLVGGIVLLARVRT